MHTVSWKQIKIAHELHELTRIVLATENTEGTENKKLATKIHEGTRRKKMKGGRVEGWKEGKKV
jgi:hypothetical protein